MTRVAGPLSVRGPRCRACLARYAQTDGLCRRCARAAGETATNREREAAQIARAHARRPAAQRVDLTPRPSLVRVIDGVEYEVWDGS